VRRAACSWGRAALGALLVAWAAPAHAAGDAAGTAAGGFLSLGTGASVLSMGGATLASGNDLASASWNVASLTRLDGLQISLAHAPLPAGASQDWLAAGGRVGSSETRWGVQTLFHREGDIEGRDAANNPTGPIAATDVAVGLRLARSLGRLASAGVGANWTHESLAGASGSGASFDAGVRSDFGPFGLAVAARHLGGTMRYGSARYDLPSVIAVGASWREEERGLRVAADFESPARYYSSVRLGGEWLWRDRVALRAGYRLALSAPADVQASGVAFGLGLGLSTMWLDYSYLPEGSEAAGEHRMGFTFRPGVLAGAGIGGVRRQERPARASLRSPAAATPPADAATPSAAAAAPTPPPKPKVTAPAIASPPAPPAASALPATPASPPASPPAKGVAPSPAPAASAAPAPTNHAPPPAQPAPSSDSAKPGVGAPPAAPVPVVRPAVVVAAEGETMAQIARRWDTSVAAIMMTNDLVSDRVVTGQKLKLPPPRTTPR